MVWTCRLSFLIDAVNTSSNKLSVLILKAYRRVSQFYTGRQMRNFIEHKSSDKT